MQLAQDYVNAIDAKITAEKKAHEISLALNEAHNTIECNVMFMKRPVPVEGEDECISIKDIKRQIVPYLDDPAISTILKYSGQEKFIPVINGVSSKIPMFKRSGIEEAFFRFFNESTSHKTPGGLVINHEVLRSAAARDTIRIKERFITQNENGTWVLYRPDGTEIPEEDA